GHAVLALRAPLVGNRRDARRSPRLAPGAQEPACPRHPDAHIARRRLSQQRPRAVVVVTGSELVRGERTDLNGPFLAREALKLGLEPARIAIVGDNRDELAATLHDALDADAILVSGGLGPTHDDRTVEMVARTLGLGLHVDEELARQIEE